LKTANKPDSRSTVEQQRYLDSRLLQRKQIGLRIYPDSAGIDEPVQVDGGPGAAVTITNGHGDAADTFAHLIGGTPQAIVDRLNAEVNKALQSDEIRTAITTYGFLPAGGTSAQMQGIIDSDIEKYRKILPTFAASK